MTEIRINYRDYPECMFAMLAAFLPDNEGDELRRVSGGAVVRSKNEDGHTYKNGLLHSFEDEPAVVQAKWQVWYQNGLRHREGDLPAVIGGAKKQWYINGKRHREGDLPAIIDGERR